MPVTLQAPFGFAIVMIFIGLWPPGTALAADQTVITDDGREVLLRSDGTWEFRSDDRFANTHDGRRVRLKADGRWEYAGNAPRIAAEQVRTTVLDIRLQKAVIETQEIKVQKNKRVRSQTVFYLELALSSRATDGISLGKDDASRVRVTDSEGREYAVLSLRPDPLVLEPGSKTSVIIRADGSPQWWKSVNSMYIEFTPGIFGIEEKIKLSRAVDDFEHRKVDGFDKPD